MKVDILTLDNAVSTLITQISKYSKINRCNPGYLEMTPDQYLILQAACASDDKYSFLLIAHENDLVRFCTIPIKIVKEAKDE